MTYFDFIEDLGFVPKGSSNLVGAMDEYVDGIQCSDRLRHALIYEEDENYMEMQEDKYQNEFIFRVF